MTTCAFWPIGPLGQARRHRVHPAQLRRRRDLQARGARVLRLPARQAIQPGVVHRGRPLPHRQAAPAALRPAGLRRRGRRARPGRGRLPGAGVDHLRPAPRGLGDGRRAGRGAKKRRGAGWLARYVRAQLAPRRVGATSASASRSRCAAALADGRATEPAAQRCRRWPSRSASASTASPRSTATALVTLALLGVRDRALTLAQVRGVLEPVRGLPRGARPGRPAASDAAHRAGVRRVLGALAQARSSRSTPAARSRCTRSSAASTWSRRSTATARIHRFVDRAIAELVSLLAETGEPDRWDEAMRLRDLLKFEFFFPRQRAPYRARARPRSSAGIGTPAGTRRDGRAVLASAPIPRRAPRAALVPRRPARRGRRGWPRRPAPRRSNETSSSTSAAASGSRCCCRAGCTAPESVSRELFRAR